MAKNTNGNKDAAQTFAETFTPVERRTISQLSKAYNISGATIRAAMKTHPLFKAEGAIEQREIVGSDYPPLAWIDTAVFDKWVKERGTPQGKVPRASGTRYVIRLLPDQVARVTELLTNAGVTMERAFTGKKAKKVADTGANGSAAEPTPVDTGELVSA